MMRYIISAFLLCSFELFIISSANAEQTFSVACNEKNEPACFEDIDGNIVGVNIEIVRELCRRLKFNLDIKLVPWKRVLSLVEQGKVDAGMPLFKTPERLKYALYPSTPLHKVAMQVYTQPQSNFIYKNLPEDLYGKTVGIRRGYSISPKFDQAIADGSIEVNELDSVEQLIKMTASSRLDAMIDKGSTVDFYLKKQAALLKHIGQVSQPQAAFLAISKRASQDVDILFRKVDLTLRAMENEGTIEKITKHFAPTF